MWKHKSVLTYKKCGMSILYLNDIGVSSLSSSAAWFFGTLFYTPSCVNCDVYQNKSRQRHSHSGRCYLLNYTWKCLMWKWHRTDVVIVHAYLPQGFLLQLCPTHNKCSSRNQSTRSYTPQSVDWCLPYRNVQTNVKRALLLQVSFSLIRNPFFCALMLRSVLELIVFSNGLRRNPCNYSHNEIFPSPVTVPAAWISFFRTLKYLITFTAMFGVPWCHWIVIWL